MGDMAVSKPMAEFFMDQCIGDHSGHMAALPNNPVISSVCKAHNVQTKKDFTMFLRSIADKLDEDGHQ